MDKKTGYGPTLTLIDGGTRHPTRAETPEERKAAACERVAAVMTVEAAREGNTSVGDAWLGWANKIRREAERLRGVSA